MFRKLFEKCLEKKEFDFLYHLSPKNLGREVTLEPRIPDPEITTGEEDEETPRVSLAPTIEQCIRAISPPLFYDIEEGLVLYVYQLVNNPELFKPTKGRDKGQVNDADKTDEVWALDSAKFKLISKIEYHGEFTIHDDYSDYVVLKEY